MNLVLHVFNFRPYYSVVSFMLFINSCKSIRLSALQCRLRIECYWYVHQDYLVSVFQSFANIFSEYKLKIGRKRIFLCLTPSCIAIILFCSSILSFQFKFLMILISKSSNLVFLSTCIIFSCSTIFLHFTNSLHETKLCIHYFLLAYSGNFSGKLS